MSGRYPSGIMHPSLPLPKSRRSPASSTQVLLIAWVLACCMLGLATGCHRGTRKDRVRVSGAWALYPLMVQWADTYQRTHPGIRVDVAAGGAGKGVTDCAAGLVEIGMLSRELREAEARKGILALPVARDAVFLVANASNPAVADLLQQGLSQEALASLWLRNGRCEWSGLSAKGRGELRLYTRSDACGAGETFALFLGARQEDLQGVAIHGDPGLGEAVRRDPGGLGYCNLNFAFDPRTGLPIQGLAVLPLRVRGHVADLSTRAKALEAVQSGDYPAPPARDLQLVVRHPISAPLRDFLRWILEDGQGQVAQAGYLPASETQRKAALAMVGR